MGNNSLHEIQERLINKLILLLAIVAIPGVIFASIRIIDIGLQPLFFIYYIAVLAVIGVACIRKRLSYVFKVALLLILPYILGIASAVNFGIAGFIIEYMMLAILIGVVFLGRRWAIYTFIISSVIITAVAILTVKGIVAPRVSLDRYALNLSSWVGIYTGFALVAALVIIVVGEIGYLLSDKMTELKKKNDELKIANNEIKKLQGIIPICARCKKIRDSDGYWNQVESYIEKHSEIKFSHGICEQCAEELYGKEEWYKELKD